MRPSAHKPHKRRRDERGFTLAELLVAISMLFVVLAAAVPVLVSSVKNEPRLRERAAKIQQARTLMEQLGRDLRSGYVIDSPGASTLVFRTYVHQTSCNGSPSSTAPTILCRITYSCAAGSCTRQVADTSGSPAGTLRTLVSGLSGSSIFSYATPTGGISPEYVQASLVYPAQSGDDALTLTDGFSFRNAGLSP